MTTIITTTGNTQFVAANATSQILTFIPSGTQTLGGLLVTVLDGNSYVMVSDSDEAATIANVTTSSATVPVYAGSPTVILSNQKYNQTPGNVYVAVISDTTANVFVTPVQAS